MIKNSLKSLMAAVKFMSGSTVGASRQTFAQLHTINGVRKLDDNIFMLDYKADYHLDELLENGGIKSVPELIGFMAKHSPFRADSYSVGVAKGGGCTTFQAKTADGDNIMGRNFDFREAPCFVVWTHPKNGYASVSIVDNNFMAYGKKYHKAKNGNIQALLAPYCPVDGINEKGLSIAVLQIRARATQQKDSSKPDITTTSMIRAVLDTCKDVDEAVEFIKSYNMHDSLYCCYHYQIIDASGRSVMCEYINDELFVYEKGGIYGVDGSVYEDDDIPQMYACNFSLKKDIGDFAVEQHGEDRISAVKNALKEKDGIFSENEAMDLLSYVKLDYDHPKYPWKIVALWSSVYNTNKATVKVAANTDYSKVYTFSATEPYKILGIDDVSDSRYPRTEWDYL